MELSLPVPTIARKLPGKVELVCKLLSDCVETCGRLGKASTELGSAKSHLNLPFAGIMGS